MEIQQSSLYRKYILALGWKVTKIDGANIFSRRFPMIASIAKIQRPVKLPQPKLLIAFLKQYKLKTVALEPDSLLSQTKVTAWCQKISKDFRLNHAPYLPTKTILVDLTHSEQQIFQLFSEAKRRAVRRALKNHVLISESLNIHELIKIKNKSAGLLGFITTSGLNKLWPIFAPKHAAILLAKNPNHQIIAGTLLLFWQKQAYYWIAGATQEGKKLFAPTLLIWEALKLAKYRGCQKFDFLGVWDERMSKSNREWLGFTKFKEGFGGKAFYYPIARLRKSI